MGLLSKAKIVELFGAPMLSADISGSVDGSQYSQLLTGEVVVLSDIPIEKDGNFVCRKGDRIINGVLRKNVETVGWLTPTGRLLNMSSFYKKQFDPITGAETTNPLNVGVIVGSEKNALAKAYFGATVTVGAESEINVKAFRPAEGEDTFKIGRWNQFTIVPKA